MELINSKCLTSESPVNEDKDKQREKERVNRIIERMGLKIAQVVNGAYITSVVARGYLVQFGQYYGVLPLAFCEGEMQNCEEICKKIIENKY